MFLSAIKVIFDKMTNKTTHKIVYSWEKIPYDTKNTKGIVNKAQIMALKAVQSVAFEGITEVLARAHGYKLSQLYEAFGERDPYVIYIKGTKEECEEHLTKLNAGSFADIKQKILSSPMLRLLPKQKRIEVQSDTTNKLQDIQDKLLAVGVNFHVTMEKIKAAD